MKFHKYHALGNDYIVLDPREISLELTEAAIQRICHRNFGIGSDGILLGPLASEKATAALRIFNPDGSEAEKSGNGLRIFSRYLYDIGMAGSDPFQLETVGGVVRAQILEQGRAVQVQMGRVSFLSTKIPVTGPRREVLREEFRIEGGAPLIYCAATIGNPHCVVLCDHPTEDIAREHGPKIEIDARFPHRTNVQFMRVIDRATIQIEIWERGAGYTLASGSSSSASAAVAKRLGLCDSQVRVVMPGGELHIAVSDEFDIEMRGAVTRVAHGEFFAEMLE